jgi:hypothetical protein
MNSYGVEFGRYHLLQLALAGSGMAIYFNANEMKEETHRPLTCHSTLVTLNIGGICSGLPC